MTTVDLTTKLHHWCYLLGVADPAWMARELASYLEADPFTDDDHARWVKGQEDNE